MSLPETQIRFVALPLLLGGILTLAACATKIPPVPEPVELPESFADGGEIPLVDNWWEAFGDAQLNDLMEKALSDNFTLKTAWDRLAQARAQARIAGADLWPSLTGSVSYEQTWQRELVTTTEEVPVPGGAGGASGGGEPETMTITRSAFEVDDEHEYTAGLVAEYELDLWGRIRSERNAEVLNAEATAEDLRAAAITLSADVALIWYRLQEQAGQVAVLKDQIETTDRTLQLIEARFRRGLTSASDVLQQRQLLESRREDLDRALSRLRNLEITLAILLGEPPREERFGAHGELIALPPLPETGLPAELVVKRPDVRAAYFAVQSADQRVAAAIADRFPRVSLSASFSSANEEYRDLFDNWLASLAANITAPIFDAGRRRAEVARTQAVASELLHFYGQTILDALGEVEQALDSERRQRAVVVSLEEQLRLARQVTERLRSEYLSGGQDFLRILDAQQSQQSLERELLTARQELIGFRIALCRALSGGWELTPPEMEPARFQNPQFYPLPIPFFGDPS